MMTKTHTTTIIAPIGRFFALFLLSLLFAFSSTEAKSQTSMNSSGGDAYSSSGSISYSVGQTLFTTVKNTSGSIALGVQQPYEITVSIIERQNDTNFAIAAFPNPVNGLLTIDLNGIEPENMYYTFYDITGKIMTAGDIKYNKTEILTDKLRPAAYILKIIKNDNIIKAFNIIKN